MDTAKTLVFFDGQKVKRMRDDFDAYHMWLGIPPAEQPPDHYRLLGIPRYETQRAVIVHAYDQRMAHLRSFQTGPRAAHSQRLLTELTRAYSCLLNARRKALYDQNLKSAENSQKSSAAAEPPSEPDLLAQMSFEGRAPKRSLRKSKSGMRWILSAVVVVALAVPSAVVVWRSGWLGSGSVAPPAVVAQAALPATLSQPAGDPTAAVAAAAPVAGAETAVPSAPTPAAVPSVPGSPATNATASTPSPPVNPDGNPPNISAPAASAPAASAPAASAPAASAPAASAPAASAPAASAPAASAPATSAPAVTASEATTAPSVSSPTPQPAVPSRYGLTFRGKDYVELGNSRGFLDLKRPFTVELWVRFAPGSDAHWLIGDLVYGSNYPQLPSGAVAGWQLWVMKTENGRHRLAVATGKGFFAECLVDDQAWRHIAVCRDEQQIMLYVDGRQAAAQPVEALVAGWTPSPLPLYIGAHPHLHPAQPPGLRGDIRGVRISSECRYLSNFTPEGTWPVDSLTLGLWDFSQNSGSRLPDRTRRYEGTLVGAAWIDLTAPPAAAPAMPAEPLRIAELPQDNDSPPAREAVPEADRLTDARTRIEELFQEELAAAKDELQKENLARKLLELSAESQELPAQYALLEQARVLAVEAANLPLACQIARAVASRFEIDETELTLACLKKSLEQAKTADLRKRVVTAGVELLEKYVQQGRFEEATQSAATLVSAATRLRDASLSSLVRERRDDIAPAKKRWTAAQEAREKLRTSPDDPQLNRIWGLFLALHQHEWSQAVSFLARCDDSLLKAAADADEHGDEGSEQLVAAGNAWWEAAQAADRRDKSAFLERALHWYRSAAPSAVGLTKVHVEKRLQEISQLAPQLAARASHGPAASSDLLVIPPSFLGLLGRVRVEGRDIGVLWRYEGGMRLTDRQVADILSRVNVPGGALTMEFVGLLRVPQSATVAIRHTGGVAAAGSHTLFIDSKRVGSVGGPNQLQDDLYKVDLAAGDHTVRWVLTGTELGSAMIGFTDADTGQALTVFHTPQLLANVRDLPMRARLNVDMTRN